MTADESPPNKRTSSGLVSGILMVFALVFIAGLIFGFGPGDPNQPPTRAIADRYMAETADVRDKIKRALKLRFPDNKQDLSARFIALDRWALAPGTPQDQVDRSERVQLMISGWVKTGGRKLAALTIERVLGDIDRVVAEGQNNDESE